MLCTENYNSPLYFRTFFFTLRILLPQYLKNMKSSLSNYVARCVPVPNVLIRCLTTGIDNNPGENNFIIVSEYIAQTLIVQSGHIVKLCTPGNKDYSTIAFVQINERVNTNEILIPHSLLYNVLGNEENEELEIYSSSIKTLNTAKSLELTLLNCPNGWAAADVDLLLAGYFCNPRVISEGDVFSVEASVYAPRLMHSHWDPELNDATIWLQAKVLISEDSERTSCESRTCLWIKQGITQIALGPSTTSYGIPSSILCPPGLRKNLKELQMATKTFLTSNARRRPSNGSGLLLQGSAGRGELWQTLALSLGLKTVHINCRELQVSGNTGQTEARLRAVAARTRARAPCLLVLVNLEVLGWNHEGGGEDPRAEAALKSALCSLPGGQCTALGVVTSEAGLAPGITRLWFPGTSLPLRPPQNAENESRLILAKLGYYQTKIVPHLPPAGPRELTMLSFLALRESYLKPAVERKEDVNWTKLEDIKEKHWQHALNRTKSEKGVSLARIPVVKWADIGGLEEVRRDVLRTIALPLRYPALRAAGLRRSGVLLHGPPGTGKTLVAKAVASECGLNFLSVKGPELLSMYVGQSEANVRDLFSRARAAAPSVVFFDELDALAPGRGRGGDGGGNVTDRVVSQLMAEMDGLQSTKKSDEEEEEPPVFVMAATNRPDLVEPALLRPGRFDKLLYVGPCEDQSSKIGVLKALTRKFHLNEDVVLEKVAECLPPNTPLTGADLYAVCSNAWRIALRERIAEADRGIDHGGPVKVHMHHFSKAASTVKSSLTPSELAESKQRQQKLP